MKIYLKNIVVIFAAICVTTASVTACNSDNKTEKADTADTKSVGEAEKSNDENISSADTVNFITIKVQAVKYEDEILTFLYDGKEYSVPFSRNDNFIDDLGYTESQGYSSVLVSEQIINNTLGETVTAKLNISESMDKIKACDVINQNGKLTSGKTYDTTADSYNAQECQYRLVRTDGSKCRIENFEESYEADLNDLPQLLKVNFDEVTENIGFIGYKFTDGKFLLNSVSVKDESETENEIYTDPENDYPCFFATVQKLTDDTAEILLNDGITTCTVPTYFNDGKLTEGLHVMVALDTGTSIYGNGENYSFDFAVFYTDEESFTGSHEFEDIAYAERNKSDMGFGYTQKDNLTSN